MKENADFIFVPKVDINEGISSGQITKAAAFFTKNYFFTMPLDTMAFKGDVIENTKYPNMQAYIDDLHQGLNEMTVRDFENELKNLLDDKYIYQMSMMEKFVVKVGFWFFGGISMRREDGPLQSMNVQPKAKREAIKAFYGI